MPLLYLLSPAKSLDYETPVAEDIGAMATRPEFVNQAAELIAVLRQQSPAQIATLMSLSDTLAQLNVARYAAWSTRFTAHNSKPAALAFNGDVYEGLQAATLAKADLAWAQKHLAILSGLYGVLRPLDRLQPYRLEMGTRLATAVAGDLYGYWGDSLAEHLNARQARDQAPVVVNLASQEYSRAARRKALRARWVDCHFEDWHGGQWKVISFHAKRARGLMARFAIQRRITRPQDLMAFDSEGYAYAQAESGPDRLVFRRRGQG
jgi:cytoplasmic iron level regulating protein YaaA (DUF328/UPF0246 family)